MGQMKNFQFQVKLVMKLFNGFVKLLIQSREDTTVIYNDYSISILGRFMGKCAGHTIPQTFSARRSSDRCLLGLSDRIKYVLDDAESVEIGKI